MATAIDAAGKAAEAAAAAVKSAVAALQSLTTAGNAVAKLIPGFAAFQSTVKNTFAAIGTGISTGLSTALTAVNSWATGLVYSLTGTLIPSLRAFLAQSQTVAVVMGALGKVGEAFGQAGKAAVQAGAATWQFIKAQHELLSSVTAFAAGAARAGAAILRLPMNVLDSAVSSIQMNVARFVRLASPGEFQRFELAVDDLYAAIGHTLIPVMQAATQFLRSIGGALMGLTTDGQKAIQMIAAGTAGMLAFAAAATAVTAIMSGGFLPVISAIVGGLGGLLVVSGDFKTVFDSLAKVVGGVLNEVGKAVTALMPVAQPVLDFFADLGKLLGGTIAEYARLFTSLGPDLGILSAALGEVKNAVMTVIAAFQGTGVAILSTGIQTLASALAMVAPYVAAFTRVVGDLVSKVVHWIAGLFGISMPNLAAPEGGLKDNTGAAARGVSTGDPSDVLRKARESAFQMGTGPNAAQQTADNTKAVATAMRETQAKIDKIVTAVEKFPADVAGTATAAVSALIQGFGILVKSASPMGGIVADNLPKNPVTDAIQKQLDRLNPFS